MISLYYLSPTKLMNSKNAFLYVFVLCFMSLFCMNNLFCLPEGSVRKQKECDRDTKTLFVCMNKFLDKTGLLKLYRKRACSALRVILELFMNLCATVLKSSHVSLSDCRLNMLWLLEWEKDYQVTMIHLFGVAYLTVIFWPCHETWERTLISGGEIAGFQRHSHQQGNNCQEQNETWVETYWSYSLSWYSLDGGE